MSILFGIGATVLVLGVLRATYVAGYRKCQERERWRATRLGEALRTLEREPEDYETDGLTTGPE
jgi:hypothetical protein